MRWLKRKLRNWLNAEDPIEQCMTSNTIRLSEDSVQSDPVLNFKVYSAVGGRVVEFRYYDRQKDRNHTTTYIITNEQDFGERIAKIATMESLKT
jgi:hypothetical protein